MKNQSALYQCVFDVILRDRVENPSWYGPNALLEACTYRIDLGRQSGKTSAIIDTVVRNQDNDYVIVTCNARMTEHIGEQLKTRFKYHRVENRQFITPNSDFQIEQTFQFLNRHRRNRPIVVFIEESMKQTNRIVDSVYKGLQPLIEAGVEFKIVIVGCQ